MKTATKTSAPTGHPDALKTQGNALCGHTPGPWRYYTNSIGLCAVGPMGNNPSPIAKIFTSEPEHEANAKLIAAAPDLLAALKYYLPQSQDRWWEYREPANALERSMTPIMAARFAEAAQAIAEAEGGR